MDGVEGNPRSAAIAREFYRDVWEIDIESDRLAEALGQRTYKYIVCADVLEHLRDPGLVLRQLVKRLEYDGRIFVSIPNIGYMGGVVRVLPAEMRKTLGHRADRLIGGFRAGVLLGERRLVVPGHPVGRVRGDRVPVTL